MIPQDGSGRGVAYGFGRAALALYSVDTARAARRQPRVA